MSINVGFLHVYYCNWIKKPHDKIAICVCRQRRWVFWFNSDAKFHGVGQLPCTPADHPGCITKSCFLDLSGLKEMSEQEIAQAESRGMISDVFRARILGALGEPIRMLPQAHRELVITNLS